MRLLMLCLQPPFLHESLMLEREEGLSREEKLEAELLYNREKNGVVPSEELLDGGSSTTLGELLSSIHRRPSAPGYSPALPYPTYLSPSSLILKVLLLAKTSWQDHWVCSSECTILLHFQRAWNWHASKIRHCSIHKPTDFMHRLIWRCPTKIACHRRLSCVHPLLDRWIAC